MGSSTEMDLAGLTLVVKDVKVGATSPGASGSATSLSSTELGFLDGVTASSGVVASKAVIANSSAQVPWNPVIVRHTTGATRTLTADQSGAQVFLDKADGVVITMPACAVGLFFEFVVVTSVTSNAYKLSSATQGTEFFDGTVNSLQDAAVASAVFTGDGTTHDNVSMNGTTTGGLVGTWLRVSCSKANTWTVWGAVRASGTEATPFATS
jgi:hypothetical protein